MTLARIICHNTAIDHAELKADKIITHNLSSTSKKISLPFVPMNRCVRTLFAKRESYGYIVLLANVRSQTLIESLHYMTTHYTATASYISSVQIRGLLDSSYYSGHAWQVAPSHKT